MRNFRKIFVPLFVLAALLASATLALAATPYAADHAPAATGALFHAQVESVDAISDLPLTFRVSGRSVCTKVAPQVAVDGYNITVDIWDGPGAGGTCDGIGIGNPYTVEVVVSREALPLGRYTALFNVGTKGRPQKVLEFDLPFVGPPPPQPTPVPPTPIPTPDTRVFHAQVKSAEAISDSPLTIRVSGIRTCSQIMPKVVVAGRSIAIDIWDGPGAGGTCNSIGSGFPYTVDVVVPLEGRLQIGRYTTLLNSDGGRSVPQLTIDFDIPLSVTQSGSVPAEDDVFRRPLPPNKETGLADVTKASVTMVGAGSATIHVEGTSSCNRVTYKTTVSRGIIRIDVLNIYSKGEKCVMAGRFSRDLTLTGLASGIYTVQVNPNPKTGLPQHVLKNVVIPAYIK